MFQYRPSHSPYSKCLKVWEEVRLEMACKLGGRPGRLMDLQAVYQTCEKALESCEYCRTGPTAEVQHSAGGLLKSSTLSGHPPVQDSMLIILLLRYSGVSHQAEHQIETKIECTRQRPEADRKYQNVCFVFRSVKIISSTGEHVYVRV